jgi:hypothetical protein
MMPTSERDGGVVAHAQDDATTTTHVREPAAADLCAKAWGVDCTKRL